MLRKEKDRLDMFKRMQREVRERETVEIVKICKWRSSQFGAIIRSTKIPEIF